MKDLIKKTSQFLNVTIRDQLDNTALLALRLTFGLSMIFLHGLAKLQNFETRSQTFPDPLHLGSPAMSLALVIFAEVVCAGLISVGFLTRLAALPLLINMSVIFFVVHGDDGFKEKEIAFFYLIAYFVILLRGSGKISVDGLMTK